MNRRLLVAHIDDLDAFVDATVVERHDVAAREREDDFDAGLLEGLGSELSTVKRAIGHGFGTFRIPSRDLPNVQRPGDREVWEGRSPFEPNRTYRDESRRVRIPAGWARYHPPH